MQYRVSISNENGDKRLTKEYTWNYSKSDYVNSEYNVTNYIDRDKWKQLAVNGSLKIYCEVDVLKIKVQDAPDISKNYLSILENEEFSDFVFVVKSKEFKVHKAILSARSAVFRAMFKSNLEETKQNRVEVTDIEVEVFEELLRYIYTGTVPDLDKYDSELFMAADKSLGARSLGSSLNAESVAAIFQLADLHQAKHLRSKCIDFITANSASVTATDGWKLLHKNRQDLFTEMFENYN